MIGAWIDPLADAHLTPIEVGLTAAIVAVEAEEPRILVAADPKGGTRAGLPFGPFDPLVAPHLRDRPAQLGGGADRDQRRLCRAALYVRRPRPPRAARRHRHAHDLGRLSRAHPHVRQRRGAARKPRPASSRGTASFPGRTGATAGPASSIRPSCRCWSSGRRAARGEPARPLGRRERLRHCFGVGGSPWDEEKVLDRYELLYEAGLVEEARRDGREAIVPRAQDPAARRGDALRPSPDSGDRHRAAARQAEIPPGGVRADAGRIHADRIAAHRRGDLRAASAQAELPPPGRDRGAGRADRRDLDRDRRAAGGAITASAATWCRSGRRPGCGSADGRSPRTMNFSVHCRDQ